MLQRETTHCIGQGLDCGLAACVVLCTLPPVVPLTRPQKGSPSPSMLPSRHSLTMFSLVIANMMFQQAHAKRTKHFPVPLNKSTIHIIPDALHQFCYIFATEPDIEAPYPIKIELMAKARSLSVATPNTLSPVSSAITSPTEPRSRSISPRSPAHRQDTPDRAETDTEVYSLASSEPQSTRDPPGSPNLTSLPPFPNSPKSTPKHLRDQSKSFFANLKASKSSNKVHTMDSTIRQVDDDATGSEKDLRDHGIYSLRKNTGSTPDLSKSTFDDASVDASDCKFNLPYTP